MDNPPSQSSTTPELTALIKSCRQLKASATWDLDDNLPSPGCSLLRMSEAAIPEHDLGTMSVLPVELVHNIFSSLDIYTLCNFLAVNRHALALVCALPPYAKLTTHAPKTLHTILAAQAGLWVPISLLAEKLHQAHCETCGDFAPYLYILTCSRTCYACFCARKEYLPMSFAHAIRDFDLSKRAREALPFMWSVPGIYSQAKRPCAKRHLLVDTESARRAAMAEQHHVVLTPGQRRARQHLARKPNLWNRAVEQGAKYDVFQSGSKLRFAAGWADEPDFCCSSPRRFVGVVRIPCLERDSGLLEDGFACVACRGRRRFNVESFEKHLSKEGAIRDGRHCRD